MEGHHRTPRTLIDNIDQNRSFTEHYKKHTIHYLFNIIDKSDQNKFKFFVWKDGMKSKYISSWNWLKDSKKTP